MTSVRATQHALQRGLSALTADMADGQQQVAAEDYPLAATELVQRIQVPVNGRVGRNPVYTELEVRWPYPFLTRLSYNQTESEQDNPHFALGVEVLTDDHILIDAQVRDWIEDDIGAVVGARMRLTAWAPVAPKKARYDAVAHLTFTGYAANAEDDDDTQQGAS